MKFIVCLGSGAIRFLEHWEWFSISCCAGSSRTLHELVEFLVEELVIMLGVG